MAASSNPIAAPLSGWAGYPLVETSLIPLHRIGALSSTSSPRAIRGNGRAYGDAAVLGGGITFSALPQNCFLEFDRERGILQAEPGVTIAEIVDAIAPGGWFLPVVPGTNQATLGGCIAADVHGKNHPVAGSFAHVLIDCTLATADGNEITVSSKSSPELFWATCGGMGLTGYIRQATVRLERIETNSMLSLREPCTDLDASLNSLTGTNTDFPHAAVWLDGFGTGRTLGRGVVSRARHARRDELSSREPRKPLNASEGGKLDIPRSLRMSMLPKTLMRLFNALYRSAQTRNSSPSLTGFGPSFFPLDAVGHWSRLYGRRGFIQYQVAMPENSAAECFREMLERLQAISTPPYLIVLKRLGAATAGPLSFPKAGFTLALDLPRTSPALPALLDEFDERVAALGGRVYLAKDSRMKPEMIAAMYPRLAAWQEVKKRIDPENRFQTDLGRRLGLCV